MRHILLKDRAYAKQQPAGYQFATDDYDHFQVIYICQGELHYSDEIRAETMRPGELLILRKTSCFVLSTPRIGYRSVCFNAYDSLPAAMVGSSEIFRATPEIRLLGQLMEGYVTDPVPDNHDLLTGLGRAMAWEAIKLSQAAHSEGFAVRTEQEWAMAAKSALDATLYAKMGTKEVLEKLPLSYRQLSRYFMKVFGQSPKRYQLNAKLMEAKKMLEKTKLSVTTIAIELGFSSSQHFATQFKIFTHQNPLEYRKSSTSV